MVELFLQGKERICSCMLPQLWEENPVASLPIAAGLCNQFPWLRFIFLRRYFKELG